MRNATLLLLALVVGCATPPPQTAEPPRKTVARYYLEANERHFAGLDQWMKAVTEISRANRKCTDLIKTNPEAVRPCLDELQLPAPETFIPKDRLKDESISEYMERKQDEWEETACFYKARMGARYIGEAERIEDQCKRDLEVKRLRKSVEKLNKQNPR